MRSRGKPASSGTGEDDADAAESDDKGHPIPRHAWLTWGACVGLALLGTRYALRGPLARGDGFPAFGRSKEFHSAKSQEVTTLPHERRQSQHGIVFSGESHSGEQQLHRGPKPLSVADALKAQLQECGGTPSQLEQVSGQSIADTPGELLSRLKCVFGIVYPSAAEEARGWGPGTAVIDGSTAGVYGEIPPESVQMIVKELRIGPGSIFYDLGSGFGRMVLQVYLTTRASKVVGVEIAKARHAIAQKALDFVNKGHLDTLLVDAPPSHHSVQLLPQNFTAVNFSDATAIYIASLFFPQDIMMYLAGEFAKMKDGTLILSLVKFPFDLYGSRRLPKNSPLQALRLRKTVEEIPMSWSEKNSLFLYEVDKAEAFRPPFDGDSATIHVLLSETYKRARIDRMSLDVPELSDSLFNTLMSLDLSSNDQVCELGTTSGWLLLRIALETHVDRVVGVAGAEPYEGIAAQAYKMLTKLSPNRIPWYRRVEFPQANSLEDYLASKETSSNANNEQHGKHDFSTACGSATVVLISVLESYEKVLNMLTSLAVKLKAGTIVLVIGLENGKSTPCVPGLVPILDKELELTLSTEMGMTTPLNVLAVAPSEKDVAALKVPGMGSSYEATTNASIDFQAVLHLATVELQRNVKRNPLHEEGVATHHDFSDIIDATRFHRLRNILGGLTGKANGTLVPRRPLGSTTNHIPLQELSRLYLGRYFGSAKSPYRCLEENLYAFASYAPPISKAEKEAGLFPEHSATYGEIDPRGVQELLPRVGGIGSHDTFFDLGSGLGKVALQVFLAGKVGHVVGVELSATRHEGAQDAIAALHRRFPDLATSLWKHGRRLEFRHDDILKANLSNATVIWMGSLAFPNGLMKHIADRVLEQVPIGCHVLTMIEFPQEALLSGKRQLANRGSWETRVRWTSRPGASRAVLYEVTEVL